MTRSNQYPAINALAHPYAVPFLIKAIKESDNELVRVNALSDQLKSGQR